MTNSTKSSNTVNDTFKLTQNKNSWKAKNSNENNTPAKWEKLQIVIFWSVIFAIFYYRGPGDTMAGFFQITFENAKELAGVLYNDSRAIALLAGCWAADLFKKAKVSRMHKLFSEVTDTSSGKKEPLMEKKKVCSEPTKLSSDRSKLSRAKKMDAGSSRDFRTSRLSSLKPSSVTSINSKYLKLTNDNFRDTTNQLGQSSLNNYYASAKVINNSQLQLLAYSKYSRWDLRSSVSSIESKPINNYKSIVDDLGHSQSYKVKGISSEKKLNAILVKNFDTNHSALMNDSQLLKDQARLSSNVGKFNNITQGFEWLNKSSFILVTDKPSIQQPYSTLAIASKNSQNLLNEPKLSSLSTLLTTNSLDLTLNLNSIYVPSYFAHIEDTNLDPSNMYSLNQVDFLRGSTRLSQNQFLYLGTVLYTTATHDRVEVFLTCNFNNSVNYYI